MNKIVITVEQEEWYKAMIEECSAIITEAVFTSQWALVEGYHQLGQRILEENENFKRVKIYGKEITTRVSQSLGKSIRTVERAIQFYKEYPKLNDIPGGKDMSWHKICNELLPAPKEKVELKEVTGKYNVIVIDPPWNYGTEFELRNRRSASPYEEIPTDTLMDHKLPSAPDCVLWLWTTHKFLKDANTLLEHWGFEYKLTVVWDKERMGMGVWLRCQAEFCLLGIKGKPEWNLTNERDVIRSKRREHSRKPDEFYEMVERVCSGKKIDYFSREKRKGWDQFGNQTEKFQG